MRLTRTLVSLAAATALVAGASIATTAPASAATRKGTTTITIQGATMWEDIDAGGLAIYALSPATSTLKGVLLSITLPAKQTAASGSSITHTGGIQFTHGAVDKGLECKNPSMELDGEAGAQFIYCTIAGTNTELDGKKSPVLALTNVKEKNKNGTLTVTADVALTDNADVVLVLNNLLGTTVFQPGMVLGDLKTTIS